ncbi:MAG: glutathione S-transferase family protein [Pseudomonadota bacterium]
MYTLIGGKGSRAFRVMWALEELGQPYEHLPETPRSPVVRQHNPAGKIPVLIDGDTAITDSTAILHYLADRHGALTAPAGTIERALEDGMTQFVLDEIDAALWLAARHRFILPEERRVAAVKETIAWELERSRDTLMERWSGPYVMGDGFSIPDIILTHCLGWAVRARLPIRNDTLDDYLERMRSRPAYRAAAERP